jgi:hypothetical protein
MIDEVQNEDPGPGQPVPVEMTDQVLNSYTEAFGPETAAKLQSVWGDKTLHNHAIAETVVKDNPEFDAIYEKHRTKTGGLAKEGAEEFVRLVAEKSGFESVEELGKQYPEIQATLNDNASGDTVSVAGYLQALAYLGKRSGYSYKYRSPKR